MTRSLPSHRLAHPSLLGLGGALALVGGAVHLPRLAALALSPDGEFAGSTEWELSMARFGMLAGGAVLVVTAAALGALSKAKGKWVAAVRRDFEAWEHEAAPSRAAPRQRAWAAITLIYLLSMMGVLIWGKGYSPETMPNSYRLVTEESGLYETLTAIMLVGAAVWLVRAGSRILRRAERVPWLVAAAPLGLGFLFFVAAGEELSWGQHYFGFSTPESMKDVNVQNEFNLHNVGGYWANNALILFFFGFAGVLPLAARYFHDVAYACERLSVPVASVWLAPFALLSPIFDEREPFVSLFGHPAWRLSEVREALFGLIMLAVCWEFFRAVESAGTLSKLSEREVARSAHAH